MIWQAAKGHPYLLTGVGMWIVFNVGVCAFSKSYAVERGYLASLRSLHAEAERLQSEGGTDLQWKEFHERGKQELERMVESLSKSASAAEPARQHLLWAAQDLLKWVSNKGGASKDSKSLYERHLQFAEKSLDKR
jgi:hypothetical protein